MAALTSAGSTQGHGLSAGPGGAMLWAAAAGLAVGAAACLHWVAPDPMLHADTARDLLIARDCSELGECRTNGVPMALAGLRHAVLWLDLLAFANLVGLGVTALYAGLLGACGLAVGIVFVASARFVRSSAALPAALLYTAALAWALGEPVLWNPLLLPVPVALATALLCARVRGAGRPALWLASALAAVAMEVHSAASYLCAAILLVTVATSRRPLIDSATVASLAAATLWLIAPGAATQNWELVVRRGASPWLVALAAVGLTAAILLRYGWQRWLGRTSTLATLWTIVGTALAATGAIGCVVALPFEPRYFHAALPAAAMLLAAALARAGALCRLPPVAPVAAALVAVLAADRLSAGNERWWRPVGEDGIQRADPGGWTLAEAELVAGWMRSRGLHQRDLIAGLQGPWCWALSGGVAPWIQPPPLEIRRRRGRSARG